MKPPADLDTGFRKSGWLLFGVGLFMLLANTGLCLVGVQVLRHGFREPWHNEAVGLALLALFSIVLSWVFLRGIARYRIWITPGDVRIQRQWLFMQQEKLVQRAEVEAIELSMTDILFDLKLVQKDGQRIPIATSHGRKQLDQWLRQLRGIAPIVMRADDGGLHDITDQIANGG